MRLLTGLGHGAAYVPAMALGSAWFASKRRGFATGIVSAGIGVGTMIAGLIIPPILKAHGLEGWRFAWYYLGAAVLLIAVLAALFIRSRPDEMGLSQVGEEVPQAPPRTPRPPAPSMERVYKVKPSGTSGWSISCTAFPTSST